jgi:hypothetical protein
MLLNIPSLNDSLETLVVTIWFLQAPKGKKAAPAPFPQGKAGGSKKAPKVRYDMCFCVDGILLIY